MTVTASPSSRHLASLHIPRPRRFPIGLAIVASAGVFASSLSAYPAVLLTVLAVAWFGGFLAGLVWLRGGVVLLTVMASMTKALTVALAVWAVLHPHSPIGPHSALDWVPLGSLNAGTGLWLLAVIRHRAR